MPDRLPWRIAIPLILVLSPLCGVLGFFLLALAQRALDRAVWSVVVLAEVVR